MPDIPNRRSFLRLASNAFAVAAVSAAGVRFVDVAEAVPVAPTLGSTLKRTDLVTPAQWGPPHGPGWRRRSRRGRRWVCWWHRGRRQCGWRW
jgi:hypothetical protein